MEAGPEFEGSEPEVEGCIQGRVRGNKGSFEQQKTTRFALVLSWCRLSGGSWQHVKKSKIIKIFCQKRTAVSQSKSKAMGNHNLAVLTLQELDLCDAYGVLSTSYGRCFPVFPQCPSSRSSKPKRDIPTPVRPRLLPDRIEILRHGAIFPHLSPASSYFSSFSLIQSKRAPNETVGARCRKPLTLNSS